MCGSRTIDSIINVMSDTAGSDDLPSGRFVLRIEPGLHGALREAAEAAGLSLNAYCARKLAAPGSEITGPAADAVERSARVAMGALLGVVAFGSWARDEVTEGSDVDLLIVVDSALSLTRDLYRSWDEAPLAWGELRVEPHFVHPPRTGGERGREPSGLWAEAALDGIVFFERGFVVSRRLAALRRRIAAGEIVRREAHGHPYWVSAA